MADFENVSIPSTAVPAPAPTWCRYQYQPVFGTLLAEDLGVAGGEGSWPRFVLVCDTASAVQFHRLAEWTEPVLSVQEPVPFGERLAMWALVAAFVLAAAAFTLANVAVALAGWVWGNISIRR